MSFIVLPNARNVDPKRFNSSQGLNEGAREFHPGWALISGDASRSSPVGNSSFDRNNFDPEKAIRHEIAVNRALGFLRGDPSKTLSKNQENLICAASDILKKEKGYNPEAKSFFPSWAKSK